jgi:uroporphyrinogen decarboxylase
MNHEAVASKKTDFQGLRVAVFESRKADEMAKLIERFGGVPSVSPSMREVPLDDNPEAVDFANRLMTGQIDIVIFMTGVGFRHTLAALDRKVDRERFLASLSDCVTIVRGPKPLAAMREVGLTPTHKVAEPNTWRELLELIDAGIPIASQTILLQEYGVPNPSLVAGLEARGANVVTLKVYDWELPLDTSPLEANVRALAAGERDVVMFTSANQVVNMLRMAEQLDVVDELKDALRTTVVVSVGPTTSERLRALGLPVDFEPTHPKMGHMVAEAAERCADLKRRKQRVVEVLSGPASDPTDTSAPWYDSPFLKACRREPTDITPVWLMRQAGRYMQEYRDVRSSMTFLELCKNPQLCSEVMCTAVKRLGVDAAIIFSDLLPILEPMGFDLEFVKGDGPVIHNPLREGEDVDRVIELESADALHYVIETVQQTRADLPDDIPLIGFAGAPFTLASYAIEGGSSRNYLHTKTLMYRDAGAWNALMSRLARAVTVYLNAQISAGAQCVQLFDSWAGCLGPDDYRTFVLPHVQAIIGGLTPGVPVINFATGNPALLPLLSEGFALAKDPVPVVGIDWRVRLDDAWKTVGHDKAVQGNLEPLVLLADRETIRARVGDVLTQAAKRPGHIFNLGHGVLQQTPVENAVAVVDLVHELSTR